MDLLLLHTVVLVMTLTLFGESARGQSGDMLMPFTTEEPGTPAGSGGSGMAPIVEGSGSSGDGLDMDHIECSNSDRTRITVSLFDTLMSAVDNFGCVLVSEDSNSTGLLFMVDLQDGTELLITEEIGKELFINRGFRASQLVVMVTVCTYSGIEECDGIDSLDLGTVTVVITAHSDRLFPYGNALNDNTFRNVLDGARPIPAPQKFPFYSNYYHTLYMSSNGLVSLNQPYISWWPIPFPYGRTPTSIIAPFWTDLDFRNSNNERSNIYYNTYSDLERSQTTSELLRLFTERLESYTDQDIDFSPSWMVVVTWSEATPYYWRSYIDQTVTFQLVFATDYISSYAFYLYPSGGLSVQLPSWRRVVIGHDPKDYKSYNNVALPNGANFTMIDSVRGNTGELGQWYFNFTSPNSEANSEQLCLEWDRQQRSARNNESSFSGLPACPCTRRQAQRDWRFWFAHFWGLSSRPNCATFLWSRGQATIECCYDSTDGSLLVGPSVGGSYLLFNPLFRFNDHFQKDRQPYQYCCQDSDRCSLFYTHRPSDDCSNYIPPRRFFIFGDPHFKSVDNRNFTFNGIGEYLLLESQANNLRIQARLEQFDPDTAGTVTTAILVQESSSPPVQVNAESGSFALYVSGNQTSLPGVGSAIIIGDGVVDVSAVSSALVGSNTEQVFVRREEEDGQDTLVITTPAGASISVTIDNAFIGLAVELSNDFRDKTRGMLGVFNGNTDDDFTLRNGTILNTTNEREIYMFGLDWHINEVDSLFSYGSDNYSTFNDGYLDFEPTFFDELNITQEVISACGDNQACILDASVTGNVDIGTSTLEDEMENEELEAVLDNKPPAITDGEFTLYVDTMQSVTAEYTVEEPDSDEISSITLKGIDGTGITTTTSIQGSTGTLTLTWATPGYDVPSNEIRLLAADKNDASTSQRISIVLCGCMNNGNCSELINSTLLNAQGHNKRLCVCPPFFGGDSCQTDMRGCGFDVCPDYAVCVNDSTVQSGYTCSNCSDGYEVIAGGQENKCNDINECSSDDLNNCSQLCINTEGSYRCDCQSGYRLSSDGFSCEDVNECFEETDDCDQVCTNTAGGFNCTCFTGYVLNTVTNECQLATCDNGNPCHMSTMCSQPSTMQFQCVCLIGQMCTGACNGTFSVVESGAQACQPCSNNSYGFECTQTCNCMNGGTCDREKGCVCTEGMWTGSDCSIEVNNYEPIFDQNSLALVSPIRWDLPANSQVVTIVANDNDTNPNSGRVLYSLVKPQYELASSVSDGLEFFTIDENTGEITNVQSLRSIYTQHSFTSFILTVSARDRGLRPRSSQATVSIVPLSVPVLPQSISPINVPENTAIGTAVFSQFDCRELGPSSGSLTLTLNSSLSGPFMIDRDTSSLAISRVIDFEMLTSPTFRLEVFCTNRHQIQDTLEFTVQIENIDDNLFKFDMPTYSISVLENTTQGIAILTVRASDADSPNAAVRYSLVTQSQAFHLNMNTGELRTTSVGLDRETQATHHLQVMAILVVPGFNTVSTATANVTITLTDINDNSPYFEPTDVYIENILSNRQIGDLLLAVFATDNDIGSNGEVRYELEANDYFEINETSGEVVVKGVITPDTLLTLEVIAADRGEIPRRTTGELVVYIRPSPERLQFSRNRYVFNVTENDSRGVRLGSVDAVILDVLNSTFNESSDHDVEYEIVNGTAQPFFIISRQTGEIYLLTSLDYETAHEYDFKVRATLSSHRGISRDVVVQVLVENLNDNAPRFSANFYTTVVEERTPAGRAILTVSAIDPDEMVSTNITFRLSGITNREPFQINSTSGIISAAQTLLNIRDYRFSVIVSDGELESEVVVFISVTRSSSISPTFTKEKYIFNISENTMPGSYVGTVVVLTNGSVSSEEYPHLGFRIVSPDTNVSLFHIDEESGNISTIALGLAEFDAESQTVLVFYAEVFNVNNDQVMYDSAAVEVHLTDINDNRPVFLQSLYTRIINTSQPVNSIILSVMANDRDVTSINSAVQYSIAAGPLGFALDSTSGSLIVTNSTLIPGQYYLTVVAIDGGVPEMNGTTTVYVAILPDTPERIEFNQSVYYFNVTENAPISLLVGTVQAFDSRMTSTVDNLLYSTPNVTRCFTLDENDGEIRVSCQLDREAAPRYELQLVASVTDGDTTVRGYSTVIIDIFDLNDNSPRFSLDVYAAVIDDQYGVNRTILQVTATDRDAGNNAAIEYSIKDPSGMSLEVTPYFRIDPFFGNISLAHEHVRIGDYRIIATATDYGIPRRSTTAVVLVCITRSQPSQIVFTRTRFEIHENVPPGTHVGTIMLSSGIQTIVPSEFSDNLQFSTGSTLFSVNNTGDIVTVGMLDREEAPSRTFTVNANFVRFGISQTAVIQVSILDRNDVRPRFSQTAYTVMIDDNAAMGSAVLQIITIDNDLGDNSKVTFSIQGATDLPFAVRPDGFRQPYTYGAIIVSNTTLLIPRSYEFTVVGIDNGNPSFNTTATVSITVEHALPAEIFFPTQPYIFNLTENIAINTFVGNISVVQETPALDGLIYRITGGNGGFFHLAPFTGTLTNARIVDRELNSSFILTVETQLPREPSLTTTATVIVNILDVNDEVPAFSMGTYTMTIFANDVAETRRLITVVATDDDEGQNAAIEYTIISGNEQNLFRIDQAGSIFPTTGSLNVSTYIIEVTATDMGETPLSSVVTVNIIIQNVIPESINFLQPNGYNFSVDENTDFVTQPLGQVSVEAIQPDDLTQYLRFDIVPSTFRINNEGMIRSTGAFDYEAAHNHTLTVTATLDIPIQRFSPKVTLTRNVEVIVFVNDLNDNAPVFVDFPYSVEQLEERSAEELVATVTATDADSGLNQQLTYTLLNSDISITSRFRMDSGTGELFAGAGLDREQQEMYFLLIQVCDMGDIPRQNCIEETISFRLLDINDNTPRVTSGTVYEVRERVPAEMTAFTITGADPDAGAYGIDGLRYILFNLVGASGVNYGDASVFREDERTGVVTLLEELDYESEVSYTARIRLRDNWFNPISRGGRRSDTNVIINVIDEPDSTPAFSSPNYNTTVDPTLARDYTLVEAVATDEDSADVLSYDIVLVVEEGNGGVPPSFAVDRSTGRVYLIEDQVFVPEARFTISLMVYDNSQFNLSAEATLIVSVQPEPLRFEQDAYTVEVSEGVPAGSELARLAIHELSVSSQITYIFGEIMPQDHFSLTGRGGPEAIISLAEGRRLDREDVDEYTIMIMAERSDPIETTTVTLTINVGDVNDNDPIFRDGENPVIFVDEEVSSQTNVVKINVTDEDIGENGRIQYSIVNPSIGFPFAIDESSGVLRVIGNIDYETEQNFTMNVLAEDSANTPRSSTQTYTLYINNLNDNFPQFSAPAYIGEVYAEAQASDLVHHVSLTVTDADDVRGEQQLDFSVRFRDLSSPDATAGYEFEVTETPPYRIRVVSLPDPPATPKLLSLRVDVSDRVHSTNVNLFIYVFLSDNLITLEVNGLGVSKEKLESCANPSTSLCRFLEIFGDVVTSELSDPRGVSFSDHSIVDSGPEMVTLQLYGSYVSEFNRTRGNNGELKTQTPPTIEYLSYFDFRQEFTDAVSASQLATFDFTSELEDPVTSEPPSEEPEPDNMLVIIIAIVCGVVVAGLCVILIIVVVCVRSRRRDEPRRKKPARRDSDPYLRTRDSRSNRRRHTKSRQSSHENIALRSRESDLAYETMYDDDEILDSKQTMPWFNPSYLAADEQYDGDNEQTQRRAPRNDRGGPVRATVDGNARRPRRYSSDESAAVDSASEVETYLDQYQHSTPMQPGQRMGEYDMFARPPDSDRPFRPSLDDLQWGNKVQS